MPLQRTYDEPDALFRIKPDGLAEHKSVLGKTDFDKALAEGWSPAESLPMLRYPYPLYRPNGSTKIVSNHAEEMAAIEDGWEDKRYAAPAPLPEIWQLAPAEAGSPAAQLALAQTSAQNMELSLKLMESNQRQSEQAAQIEELKRQNAEILDAVKAMTSKGKPKAE